MCKPSEEKNMQIKSSVKGEKQTAEELNTTTRQHLTGKQPHEMKPSNKPWPYKTWKCKYCGQQTKNSEESRQPFNLWSSISQ